MPPHFFETVTRTRPTLASLVANISHSLKRWVTLHWGYRILYTWGLDRRSSFSVSELDKELCSLFSKRKGFYVELGAFDGVAQSNTLLLERDLGWTGILVEPVSCQFESLRKNRSHSRNKFVNAAAVPFSFHSDTITIATGGLMSSVVDQDADMPDALENARAGRRNQKMFKGKPGEPELEVVPAIPLSQILRDSSAPENPDFLSLDCEGYELEVLRGLDLDEFPFAWILVESRELDKTTAYLSQAGYSLVRQLASLDYLYKRN